LIGLMKLNNNNNNNNGLTRRRGDAENCGELEKRGVAADYNAVRLIELSR